MRTNNALTCCVKAQNLQVDSLRALTASSDEANDVLCCGQRLITGTAPATPALSAPGPDTVDGRLCTITPRTRSPITQTSTSSQDPDASVPAIHGLGSRGPAALSATPIKGSSFYSVDRGVL